jgi:hypothetical protein
MHAIERDVVHGGLDHHGATAVAADELSYDSCVPRSLVHKKAVSEVFLTDARELGPDRFAVAAQWPRDHVFFSPGQYGTSDSLLWIETARQAGIYLSHRFYGVPLGHPFILTSVDFTINAPVLPETGPAPLAVTLEATCDRIKQNENSLSMSMEASVWVDGVEAGRVGMTWQAVTMPRYEAVRTRHGQRQPSAAAPAIYGTVPLPPEVVRRRHERDVLLGAGLGTGYAWNLRLDTGHPVLFDHGSDHVPGIALIEAFSQAAAVTMTNRPDDDPTPRIWVLRSGAFTFDSFGEHDMSVLIVARPEENADGEVRDVKVAALQGARSLCAAVLRGTVITPGAERQDGGR